MARKFSKEIQKYFYKMRVDFDGSFEKWGNFPPPKWKSTNSQKFGASIGCPLGYIWPVNYLQNFGGAFPSRERLSFYFWAPFPLFEGASKSGGTQPPSRSPFWPVNYRQIFYKKFGSSGTLKFPGEIFSPLFKGVDFLWSFSHSSRCPFGQSINAIFFIKLIGARERETF